MLQYLDVEVVYIVNKGGHIPPFSEIPPFLEIEDVPTFHRFLGKQKNLIILVTNLYIISTPGVS